MVFGAGRSVRVLDALQQTGRGPEQLCRSIEQEVRYANITIIEGNQASQFGIGMVSARIAEIVLRDERGVIPIGSYNPKYGFTLSMPSVLGQTGVAQGHVSRIRGRRIHFVGCVSRPVALKLQQRVNPTAQASAGPLQPAKRQLVAGQRACAMDLRRASP